MRPLLKASWPAPKSVGVISSRADLRAALRLRSPPDFFELRLDALVTDIDKAERTIPKLPAPLIITARHPLEGCANRARTIWIGSQLRAPRQGANRGTTGFTVAPKVDLKLSHSLRFRAGLRLIFLLRNKQRN